jgi:hypothetical protein
MEQRINPGKCKKEVQKMYNHYYVNDNAQSTGEHEVHKENCTYLQMTSSKTYLGYYYNCIDAIKKAKEHYYNIWLLLLLL